MADNKKLLGKRLRELRKRHSMTLAELSEKINVEPSTLGNIENGYNYPKISTLESLSEALNCSVKDFFTYEHLQEPEYLIEEISNMLKEHPEQIKPIYKMLHGLFS